MCHCRFHPLPSSRDVGHLEGYYTMAEGSKRWRGGPSIGGPARYHCKTICSLWPTTHTTFTLTDGATMSPAAPWQVCSAAMSQLGQALREAMTNLPHHPPANDHSDDPTRLWKLNGCLDNPTTMWTTQWQCGQPNNSADNPTTVWTTQQQCTIQR